MNLTKFRSLGDGAKQIYRSGGIRVLLYRVVAYTWKGFAWFWICAWNRDKFIKRTICENTMYLNRHDAGISKELAVYGVHEPLATKILRNEIKAGMHMVDIGANIGYYALQEARLVTDTGKVIAIEPVPDSVKLLRKNVEANGYQNISIYPLAIGDKNGIAKIWLTNNSNLASLVSQDRHSSSVDVPMKTLDCLLENEKQVDYIQLDIEGYEVEIIKGMRETLRKYKPGIFVEIHPSITGGGPVVRFLEELKDMGYRSKYVIDKAFNYPVVKKKNAIEKIPLDELMRDKRITQGRAVFSLFLEAS